MPLGEALQKALYQSTLTGERAQPFHLRVALSEPENPQSAYQASIEEWWISSKQWRREVTSKDGMHQTIVVANGAESERDEGDYFPLWLRTFVTAIFEPVAWASQYSSTSTIEQSTLPNGDKSDACVRSQSTLGSGERASTTYTNICFDNQGRLKFVGSPRYSMGFYDYRPFGELQIARVLADDPESGTHVEGKVVLLEILADNSSGSALFALLPTTDNRFRSVVNTAPQMEQLTASVPAIVWPSVRSGNLHGHQAMYLSVDNLGQVREAWPLASDNGGVDDSARDQVRKWKIQPPVDKDGKPIQIDGGLSFVFDTKLENAIPTLTSTEDIARQIGTCPYNPVIQKGLLPPKIHMKIDLSIDEKGQEVNASFPPVSPQVIEATHMKSRSCIFKPYLVNGQPVFYHLVLSFMSQQ